MVFYLSDSVVEGDCDLKRMGEGNGRIYDIQTGNGESTLFLQLSFYDNLMGYRFRVKNDVVKRLADELGVSSLQDVVGREFSCHSSNGRTIDAISPATFSTEDFSEVA